MFLLTAELFFREREKKRENNVCAHMLTGTCKKE